MKKILVVGMSNNIGGTETYFHNYYKQFDLNKYHFDFITAWGSMAFADEYKKNGSKVFVVPNFMKNPIGYYKKMRKIIREGNYNIIHINMLSAANILPVKAALAEKVPKIIVHSHNTDMPKGLIRKLLHNFNKTVLRKSELTRLACSGMAGKWLFGDKCDFDVINNAIDLKKFRFSLQNRKMIRAKYQIRDDELLIGNVGRLCKQKNQIFLLEMLKEMNNVNAKLMIVGSGDKKVEIQDRAKKYDLRDRVVIVPATMDIEKYYSAFDVFVLPSKFEGLPVSAVEAIANGLDCVLLDSVSGYEIFENQKFLSVNDVDEWVNDVSNREIGTRMNNDEHIKKHGFDISTEFSKLAEVYSK